MYTVFPNENTGLPNENNSTIFQNLWLGSKDLLESLGFVHHICEIETIIRNTAGDDVMG